MAINTPIYPCDRGMPNGPRGLHEFVTYAGGVPTCRYCGATRRPSFDSHFYPVSTPDL